jgi:HSP20 family protein
MTLLSTLVPTLRRARATERSTEGNSSARIKPFFQVKESNEAYGLEVHLPGVNKSGLELNLREGSIHLVGRRNWSRPEGWVQIYRESPEADFELELEHDNSFDADKVHAELRDGILRVTLPKSEAVKPRKITVA